MLRRILTLFALAATACSACADILINEISAVQTDRLLRWDENEQPYVGSGAPWWSEAFDDSTWETGNTPIGFDLGTIATNVRSEMRDITPSLYVRKTFTASASQANSNNDLVLRINCNDGFIAWLNGVEVARCNMGADKAHIYADQLAYRGASTSTATTDITLGSASDLLENGGNTLAIQVANYTINSSLRLDVALRLNGANLIPLGSNVSYLPGVIEPSSDLSEPAARAAGTSDWIELHNNGASDVDLEGWTLSDDATVPGKWAFPAGSTIPAGEFLVVLADNPDSPISNAHFLHTNFKLTSGGEYLGLFNDAGVIQDSIDPGFPKQFAFYSYGRSTADNTFAYLGMPTPGAANALPAFTDKVDAPDFDVKGGFFNSAVTFTLSSQTPGASIRYTTDGTEPTESTGTAYSAPVTLEMITNRRGHVIRARAFLDGLIPSNTKTNTYLIGQDSRLRNSPALVYAADLPKSLYDPYGVLAINGGSYPNNQWQPTAKTDYNNVFNRGRAFERPIHAEYYLADGSAGFRTDCGVRIAASSFSRPRMMLNQVNSSPWPANPVQKPSFNLYFRDEYGNPSVSLPFNGVNAPVNEFEQFRIRAGKNDIRNPFIIDELVRRLCKDMGQVSTTGVINTLYVNGELKGFYNMVERLREPFFRSHHSEDPNADWDVLQYEGNDNIASGDKVAWNEMISRLDQPETPANWQSVLEMVDITNVADYFMINIYMSMWDWPHNNWVAARERSPAGRYRLYVWDAEGAMDNRGDRSHTTNMIEQYIIGTQAGTGRNGMSGELRDLWNGLNEWEEFRLHFADRVNRHFFNGGVLDDRDYDTSHLKMRNEELVAEFSDLLRVMNNEAVTNTHARNWATTTKRRNYLLGPNRENFRDHDLWPVTTPPQFTQFGGNVPDGFALNITNESGEIYYTTDGSDPRLVGGTPNPSAVSQPGSTLDLDLIEAGATWKFDDSGTDLGTSWRDAAFDDNAWSVGAAPLGYGNITNTSIATPMNTARNPTAYIRSTFEIDDATAFTELSIAIHVDGGAAVYINGDEAVRDGMPAGEITFNTNSSTDGNEGVFDTFTLDPALLVTGTNIIAVEVHNRTPGSSDMVIDIDLDATRTNPNSPPLPITEAMTVRARSLDDGVWSALTEADFTVATIPPTPANLAVTEILYNPSGPSEAELGAGVTDGDQFEFLQIKNLAKQSVDLHGVRFVDGISFDFGTSDIRVLPPGAVAIILSDAAAFRVRNGDAFDAVIAGQYSGKLNNGGEHMRLIDSEGVELQDFTYSTAAPWPDLSAPADDGRSIQIVDPAASHDDGSNWQASAQIGGDPGGNAGTLTFAQWQTANFPDPESDLAAPGSDPDGDGFSNFAEFALGTPPNSIDNGLPNPIASLESFRGSDYLTMEFTRHPGERAVSFAVQTSSDLSAWEDSTTIVAPPTANPDGTITTKIRDNTPAMPNQRRYIRLKMSAE